MTQNETDNEIKILKSKLLYFFYGAMLALFLIFSIKRCTPEPSIAKSQIVKEQKGTFKSVKPINKPLIVYKEKFIKGQNLSKKERDFLQMQIDTLLYSNSILEKEFITKYTNDSLKLEAYKKAITLNVFTQNLEDKKVKITASGITRGTLESIKLDYAIKEQEIPIKQRIFALKTGLEYGNDTKLNKSVIKANLGIELKNGKTISFSYDTDSRYWLGYHFILFDIKK